MEMRDSVNGTAPLPPQTGPEVHGSIDRFEVTHRFEEREEEEKVEAAMALYEKAARARMLSAAVPAADSEESEEEREARSQQLKLQQKCQDIAALMMVEELEDDLDSEE